MNGSYTVEASLVMGLLLLLLAAGIVLLLGMFAEDLTRVAASAQPDPAEAARQFRLWQLLN